MPRYKVDNKIYNIPDSVVQRFLQKNPSAELLEDETVKTSTTLKSPDVDVDNISDSQLNDFFSESSTDQTVSGPSRGAVLTNTKPIEKGVLKEKGQKNIAKGVKFNPDNLSYDELKAQTDKIYKTRGSTPSGLLRELDRLKSKKQSQKDAVKGYYDITNILDNIPEQEYFNGFADRYFNLEDRPKTTTVTGTGSTPGVQGTQTNYTQSIEEYLGPEKYKQYLQYQETQTFDYDTSNAEIQKLRSFSDYNVKRKTAEFELRKFESEETQGWIERLIDKNKPYKTDEEAKEALKKEREVIYNSNVENELKIKEFEQGAGGKIKNEILESNSELRAIIQRTEDNNMQFASDEDRLRYKELVDRNGELRKQYVNDGYEEVFNSIIDTYKNNQFLQQEYINKVKDYNTASIFEGALALDYSETARTAQALEEFFIGDMVVGSLSLLAEGGLRLTQGLFSGLSGNTEQGRIVYDTYQEAIDIVKQKTTDYNTRLAEKRQQTIPENLKIEDAVNGKVGYLDWLSESFANNSPSILTTFIPAGLAMRGAAGVKAAQGLGTVALNAAKDQQLKLATAGMRTAQGIFFLGESGGKFREVGDNENYTFSQKAFTSYAFGGVATYAETLGSLRLIQGAGNLAGKIGIDEFKKEMYQKPLSFGFNLLKKGGKALTPIFFPGIPVEVMEEVFTQIGHNALDIVVLKENKDLLESVDLDFILNTAVSVTAIMGPTTGGNVMNIFKNEFRIKSEVEQNQKWVTELISTQEAMQNATGKELEDLTQTKNDLLQNLALADVNVLNKLSDLSPDQLQEVVDINRRMREIQTESQRLGGLTENISSKRKALERLKEQYNTLLSSKEQILGTRQKKINEKEKEFKENNKDFQVTNPVFNYHLGLYEMYSDIARRGLPEGGQYIKVDMSDQETAVNQLFELGYTRREAADLYQNLLASNASIDGNNILINETNILRGIARSINEAKGSYAAVAPLEELFHLYTKGLKMTYQSGDKIPEGKVIGDLKIEFEEVVDQTIKKLKDKKDLGVFKNTEPSLDRTKEFNALLARMEDYKNGTDIDYEELLAQLNNAVALGVLTRSDFNNIPSLKNFINSGIANVFGNESWFLNIKNESDVFNFIKNFQSKAGKKIIGASPEDDKEGRDKKSVALAGFAAEIDTFAPKQGQTIESYRNDPNYYSLFQAIGNVENETTKIKGFQNQTLDAKFVKAIKNVASIVTKGRLERDLDIQAIRDNLSFRFLKNYDPVKNPSVFGWMTSGAVSPLRGAVLDQIKAFKSTPTDQASSFDIEQGQVGAVQEMASTDVDFTENIDQEVEVPRSQIKQEAPFLIDQALEEDVETAILEIATGIYPNVESKEFLPFIKEVLAAKLTKKFQKAFGTNTQYKEFIKKIAPVLKGIMPASFFVKIESQLKPAERKFTKPPVRLTTQKDIDKARENEQINYLENDAQGANLYELKKFTNDELVDHFLGKEVKPSTKGTRKTSAATSVATQTAFDMIPSIFKGKVSEIELSKISEKIRRDPRIKFSKAIELSIQELFKLSNNNPNFDLELAGINKLNTQLTDKGLSETLDLKKLVLTPEGRKEIVKTFKWIMANLGPREMWFGKQGKNKFTTSGSDYGISMSEFKKVKVKIDGKLIKKTIKNPKYSKAKIDAFIILRNELNELGKKGSGFKFGKPIDGVTDYSVSGYSTLLGNPKNAAAKNKKKADGSSSPISEFNTKVRLIHEGMWTRIYNLIGDDKKNAPIIGSYLKLVANHTGHWHKIGAEIVGWSTNPKGIGKTLYEYEHAMPATAAYLYLMDVALNQTDFKPAYNAVMDNYKLIALDKAENAKLGKAGLGRGMPEGWMLGDNYWWQRYFNEKMATIEGGINPASIIFTNGRTFEDQLQINSAGQLSKPALIKAQQNVKNKINIPILRPTGIKFAKSDTNQNVLNEMERLDNEASDARIKQSKAINLNEQFNTIIEKATGIGKEKRYGQTKARAVGADKGRFDLLGIPPSAQDFVGLTRYFAGKGKQGDETIAWVKKNFLDPFARANIDISNARVALANDFKALKKLLNVSPKDLNKKIIGEPYTVGNAVRVYVWGLQGMDIPGLSKADANILNDYVLADENLQLFANELIAINKDNGYPKPGDSWLAGTITTDLLTGLNTVVRAKYLEQWQNNVNEVFTGENMNKLEAAFGNGYRDALENMLGRMKTGSNRGFKGDTLTGRFVDWLNASVGTIMFFNMRSAVLQTISAVNFVNFTDNNPLKAAAAFGNQLQYWKDVIKLMNSDYLVERRNGLKINVNEADIAEIAAESKNKAKAFINKILKLGFLPTQIADSFAIASGGATFYRNRYKSLKKQGLSDKDADAQAFQDFREIAEESQQSSRPDRISKQQAGPLGRLILAFANTPAQYARLMQKAASDLKNRRGDDKTNISKILYYGFIQNVIFNALQQALFAMAFADEDPDEEKKNKKYTGIVNGMADSLLRGIGFHGAAISTLKNVIMKLASGAKAQDAAIEMLDISPPISSKIGKLRSAGRTWDWNKKEIYEKGWSFDNPAWLASGQVISAATNIPLDRGIRKLQNLKDASDAENEEWMRVANALGWQKWELDWQKDEPKKKSKKTKRKSIYK